MRWEPPWVAVARCQLWMRKTMFSKDFQGFPITVRFCARRKRHCQAYSIFRQGTIGKHKEFQRFQWNPSVVPHRTLGTSLGCCCALPALDAEKYAFPKDFQGINNRKISWAAPTERQRFQCRKTTFSTVLGMFFLGPNVFSLAGCLGTP